MMFTYTRILILSLIFVFTFFSCKNDLTIVAPYKEIPSVYAIITPQERTQMIRINKVFLGEGDANVMAKEIDSVNYKAGELTVMLERFVNGAKATAGISASGPVNEVVFRDSLIKTDEGAFNTNQRVYLSNDKLFSTGQYKLTIKNNTTGNIFTAVTNAVDSVPLTSLPPFAAPFYPVPYNASNPASYYIDYSGVNVNSPTYSVRTKASIGGFLHDLTIRVHYFDSLISGAKLYNNLDYVFSPQQLKDQVTFNNSLYFNFTFKGANLFLEYANMMLKRPFPAGLLGRKTYKIDFISYAATQDYYDYLQFAAPSLSFTQEKTLYSNFIDKKALGIFTFRTRCLISKEMATAFVDQFSTNKYTCQFKFYSSTNVLNSCP
jgi:hypothetical protein